MATDEIVDNSPEMALDNPVMQDFLKSVDGPAPEAKVEKTDVKPQPAASSAAPAEEPETPADLRAQIKGLQAELTRRQGNSSKVEALETELNSVKEKLANPKPTNEHAWIQKLDDDDLSSKQTDWDDELADARAKYGRAEDAGDERAMERQGQRILTAKKTISAFKKETLDRTKRVNEEANTYKETAQSISAEIDRMREGVLELMPDLITQGTEAWEAGNKEYLENPYLMKQLGPLGEVVAAAMAVIKNPDLIGKKTTASARKEIIGSLEKSVKKSLSTGSSASSSSRSVDYAAGVQSGDGLAAFNQMIDKIKGG